MVENQAGDYIHQSKAQGVFNSKKELWKFLSGEGKVYLPDYENCPMSYLAEVFQGKRPYVQRIMLNKAFVPQIKGLYLKDILQYIRSDPALQAYFPSEEEIVKCGKDWVCNVLATVAGAPFSQFVREQEIKRRGEIDQSQRNNIPVAPAFKQALESTHQASMEKGRAVSMLKPGSKKKRTRKEVEEVKEVESRLKEDRQGFLKEYQQLKRQSVGGSQQNFGSGGGVLDQSVVEELAKQTENLKEQNSELKARINEEREDKVNFATNVQALYDELSAQVSDNEGLDTIFKKFLGDSK